MAALSPIEIERIREEELVRAQVRAEVALEQARRGRSGTFAKTLAIWLLLVVVIVGVWRVFASGDERRPGAEHGEHGEQ